MIVRPLEIYGLRRKALDVSVKRLLHIRSVKDMSLKLSSRNEVYILGKWRRNETGWTRHQQP